MNHLSLYWTDLQSNSLSVISLPPGRTQFTWFDSILQCFWVFAKPAKCSWSIAIQNMIVRVKLKSWWIEFYCRLIISHFEWSKCGFDTIEEQIFRWKIFTISICIGHWNRIQICRWTTTNWTINCPVDCPIVCPNRWCRWWWGTIDWLGNC